MSSKQQGSSMRPESQLGIATTLQSELASAMLVWANRVFGEENWEAVGVARFYEPESQENCICRQGALVNGKSLELGDEVDERLTTGVPLGHITEMFQKRNDIPNNNWWNYKMIVWSDGRAQTFMSYDVLDGEDPRLWADESEFTFGPFEEEPVLRR